MFYGMKHWILWLSICHISCMSGENLCKRELLISTNISTELQSDVLLPCNFNSALLGSDKTADIAVVWSQRNTTEHLLLDINLRGEERYWNNKGGRIKAFRKLSESGNFSILLQKVQPYDLSLYRCELFNGSNCIIAYQDLHLHLGSKRWTDVNWLYIAGGGGGAVVLTLFVVFICFIKRARSNASDTHVYANSSFDRRNDKVRCEVKDHSSQRATKAKNTAYANKPQNLSNTYANCHVEPGAIYTNQPH